MDRRPQVAGGSYAILTFAMTCSVWSHTSMYRVRWVATWPLKVQTRIANRLPICVRGLERERTFLLPRISTPRYSLAEVRVLFLRGVVSKIRDRTYSFRHWTVNV